MKILCVGVSHQSAPLEVREPLAFDRQTTARALADLRTRHDNAEFVILSTCNRVEVYCAAPAATAPDGDALLAEVASFHGIPADGLKEHAYRLEAAEAVRHLFEVASSLDSMVVGESQILGQAKEAYLWAVEADATGKVLNRLFHRAFHTAKRVHEATDIGWRRTSVASVAVDFASRIFADLASKRVLIVGAGEMAERAAEYLRSCGAGDITVANRTDGRADEVAARFAARTRGWDDLDEALSASDIVICSTASPQPILTRARAASAHKRRDWANWLILDLAVPRDVEASVGRLANVYLYDVDALGRVAGENLALRQREAGVAGSIVADEVQAYMDWFEARAIGPLVEQLEARLHALGDEELERLFRRLPDDLTDAARSEIRLATHRIVHKLLHMPIERLKAETKADKGHMSLRVLRRLFGLDGPDRRP